MDDALLVSGGETSNDLLCVVDRLSQLDRTSIKKLSKFFTFE